MGRRCGLCVSGRGEKGSIVRNKAFMIACSVETACGGDGCVDIGHGGCGRSGQCECAQAECRVMQLSE